MNLPFCPSEYPVLEEHGATLADAEAAEGAALEEIQADREAGKVSQESLRTRKGD